MNQECQNQKILFDQNKSLTMEEVDEALNEIESKYKTVHLPKDIIKGLDIHDENLLLLLQDFNALGLPDIDTSQSKQDIFSSIITNALSLVETHRRNLSHLGDYESKAKMHESQLIKVQKQYNVLKNNFTKLKNRNNELECSVHKLQGDCVSYSKVVKCHKDEIAKIKHYYTTKEIELKKTINRLEKENEELKDLFGQSVGKYRSKDDIIADYLKKCKVNEEIYKSTILKLHDNNDKLIQEVINLKEEYALFLCEQA